MPRNQYTALLGVLAASAPYIPIYTYVARGYIGPVDGMLRFVDAATMQYLVAPSLRFNLRPPLALMPSFADREYIS